MINRVGYRYVERGSGIGMVWESFRMGEDRICSTSLDGLMGCSRSELLTVAK